MSGNGNDNRLILASASPRRRELLAAAGIACDVVPPEGVDEAPLAGEPVETLVCRLAEAKAAAVVAAIPTRLVLGADTVVYHAGEVLGKPADLAAAAACLRRLSGQTHEVYTGVCLLRREPAHREVWFSVSQVTFRELSEADIAAAMLLSNPLDKAGAYAIQEQETILVAHYCGWRSTIVGLPVEEVAAALNGQRPASPPR